MMGPDDCVNCGIKPRRRGGVECEACARYRQRTGRARPLYLIEREVERAARAAKEVPE